MTEFGYVYVCAIGADTRITAKSRGCRKYGTPPEQPRCPCDSPEVGNDDGRCVWCNFPVEGGDNA